jgi:hypothetical protein
MPSEQDCSAILIRRADRGHETRPSYRVIVPGCKYAGYFAACALSGNDQQCTDADTDVLGRN